MDSWKSGLIAPRDAVAALLDAVEARLVALADEDEPDQDAVLRYRHRRAGRVAAALALAALAVAAICVACGKLSPDTFRTLALALTPLYFVCASVKG